MRRKFKIEIGQVLQDDKRNITIIDREYRPKEQRPDKKGRVYVKQEKWYRYKCNHENCRYEDWKIESSLVNQKSGCGSCSGRVAALGISTIYDTNKWMIDLGVSEEDAKKYKPQSHEKINVKCPCCKKQKEIVIYQIYANKSIGCICGDGVSFGEKFMSNILNQLKVNYIRQLSKTIFDWVGDYKYDFYIPSTNTIIECNGVQHYRYTGFKRTLKEEQRNDKIKMELAKTNGIDNYIVIDCSMFNAEYIKDKILNSELSNIFNLSNINWGEVEKFSLSNLIKEVAEYWNNKKEFETTKDIAEMFGVNVKTIRRYLNKGDKLNLCNYNSEHEKIKGGIRISKKVEIFKDGKSLGVFESVNKLSERSINLFGVELKKMRISEVARGKRNHHKGYTFKYVENQMNQAS